MKRFFALLILMLCAVLAFSAQAATVAPGDTVDIPVSISTSDAYMVKVKVNYDANVFEYIGIACPSGQANNGYMSLYSIEGVLPSGQIGTVTFKIKEGVKNGTYGINVTLVEAWTLDEDYASVSVSSGTVTIYSECKHTTTEEQVTKEADCTNEGSKNIVCSDCGEVIKTEKIDALDHDFGKYEESKAPTCTEKGEETSKCSRCDETKTQETPALDHDFGEYEETTAPTCTEKGEKTSKCSRCDETKTQEIAALGHEFSEYKETTPATCTTDGERTGYCVRCNQTATQVIAALGHDFGEYKETKAPTCTEKGEKTSKCSRCDEKKTEEIAALDHDFGEYEETTAPTCTEKGEKTSKCSRCDEKKTEEIAALGHDFSEYEVTKAPTCTEKGEKTSKCSRCDEKKTEEIAALGHNFGEWVEDVAATCTTDGAKHRVCANCDEREEVVVPAPGHNGVWKTIKPATGKEEGLKQKVCKRCNEILDEQIIPIRRVVYKTACTAGIKVSELAALKDANDSWKMVTPVDLSVEGTTRYPLIAGNVYEIGYVEVTVADGKVTAELVIEAKVTMYTSALVLLSDVSEIKRFTANDYEHYEFPAAIELSDLPSDEMLMMVICQLTIDESKPEPKYYNFKGAEHAALIEALNEIIK